MSYLQRLHSNQRVFHEEEPLIPAVPPVKDLPPQDKYQWMAWNSGPTHKNSYDSAHSDNLVPINELPVSEVEEDTKEEEVKSEEKEKIDFPVFKGKNLYFYPSVSIYIHMIHIQPNVPRGHPSNDDTYLRCQLLNLMFLLHILYLTCIY